MTKLRQHYPAAYMAHIRAYSGGLTLGVGLRIYRRDGNWLEKGRRTERFRAHRLGKRCLPKNG